MMKALHANGNVNSRYMATLEGFNAFVAGAEQLDDITMLCLKYIGPKK